VKTAGEEKDSGDLAKIKAVFEQFHDQFSAREQRTINLLMDQSVYFKKFWQSKMMNEQLQTIPQSEMAPILRLLESSAEKVPGMEIIPVARTGMVKDNILKALESIHANVEIRSKIDELFRAQDKAKQVELINQIYNLNKGKRNYITGNRAVILNGLLYLYAPDKNLAVLSLRDRYMIMDYLGIPRDDLTNKTPGEQVIETRERLLEFKEKLRPGVSTWEYSKFLYDESMKPGWKKKRKGDANRGAGSSEGAGQIGPNWWIEKATQSKHKLEQPGLPETAFGKSLWSPQKSGNQRRWENMTKVKPGDIVLHLSQDSNTFLGVSKVKAEHTTFTIPQGTDWTSNGPTDGYHVELYDYTELTPPIKWFDLRRTKETELRDYYAKSNDSIFFDKNLDLNQGAYLTRAPEPLVAIINEYYRSVSEQNLPFFSGGPTNTTPPDPTTEKIKEALEAASQVILYGPPGTGKTYAALKFVETIDDNRKMFITFHPSYSYEEFIEGIRPNPNPSGGLAFEVKDGKFKAFCMEALNALLDSAAIHKTWDTSKSLLALSPEEKSRVQAEAKKDQNKFYLIIDEINRGDISKIFGELITLLEADKRLTRENQIIVPLTYSSKSPGFGIPPNLFIIGTMNTADRSIALIDVALRRRFRFVELLPDYKILEQELRLVPQDIREAITGSLKGLNNRLRMKYDRNHQIGHAYFIKLRDHTQRSDAIRALKRIWWYEIIPLLDEYFYNNGRKFYEVLKENPTIFEEPPSERNNFTFVLKDPDTVSEDDFVEFLKAVASLP
jgi:MoxR-like ATPase